MKKIFKLIQGQHWGISYVAPTKEELKENPDLKSRGAVMQVVKATDTQPFIESEVDLMTKFPNRFELYNPSSEGEAVPKSEQPTEGKTADPQFNPKGFGENKTDSFPLAKKHDLLVFKKGKNYTITKDDDPNRAINSAEQAITNQDTVNNWIVDFVGESEENEEENEEDGDENEEEKEDGEEDGVENEEDGDDF